ncbi:MAG: prolipoprotein diacylglyceryl transferase [Chloroflexota bacterium]
MIDPVIFSIKLFGGLTLTLRWYGVLVMLGVMAAAWLAERELKHRGENGEHIWNSLIWALPAGVIGARLWYVANATLGGNSYYMDNPGQILNIPAGGLHFYGGLLFGALAMFFYIRRYKLDLWLLLDVAAPVTMIGQAVARPANFINQELYGQPTTLPWGIPIEMQHRIPLYSDMSLYPESTRFHPAFAYEMLWNFLAAGLLLWAARRFPEKFKPGAMFAWWLVLAGVGRVLIEFFRPDQPRIPGTDVSYTTAVSALMALAGGIMLLARYGYLRLKFAEAWEEAYQVAAQPGGAEAA